MAGSPPDTLVLKEEPATGRLEKSVPVVESATLCGLPGALSVMLSVPFRDPAALAVINAEPPGLLKVIVCVAVLVTNLPGKVKLEGGR